MLQSFTKALSYISQYLNNDLKDNILKRFDSHSIYIFSYILKGPRKPLRRLTETRSKRLGCKGKMSILTKGGTLFRA